MFRSSPIAAPTRFGWRAGPSSAGKRARTSFVVRDGRAFRTRVDLGLIGYDLVEIARGLEPGDEMIVSDMTNYLHARELKLK